MFVTVLALFCDRIHCLTVSLPSQGALFAQRSLDAELSKMKMVDAAVQCLTPDVSHHLQERIVHLEAQLSGEAVYVDDAT